MPPGRRKPKVAFDVNQMQFLIPPIHPVNPLQLALTLNGMDMDSELAKMNELILILQHLSEQTEDLEQRIQLEEAMQDLAEQKHMLLLNVMRNLRQFWRGLRTIKKLLCPHCGRPFFFKYLSDDDSTNPTS